MANPVGRPRLYQSVEEFDQKVQEFKAFCEEREEPATWTGLCLFMGFSCRASLDEYANYPEFSYSVKKAKTFIEYEYEKKLHAGNATGAIFALKNFGWNDKQEIDHRSTDGSMSPSRIEIVAPDDNSEN